MNERDRRPERGFTDPRETAALEHRPMQSNRMMLPEVLLSEFCEPSAMTADFKML
jgi:hypothetical protein